MIFVPLIYLLVGLLYASLRQRTHRTGDIIELLIMVVFWPMHVISSEPPAPLGIGTLELVDLWIERLRGRGPQAEGLVERLLDARARVAIAIARGAPESEMRKLLAPLFECCSKLA